VNLATIIDGHPHDDVALVSRRRETTYGELREQAARLQAGLAGLGLAPGDRVALACGTNWFFVVSYLAVLRGGFVAVPLNPTAPVPEVAHALRTVAARAIVAGPAARGTVAALDRGALPELHHVILAGGAHDDEGPADGLAFLDDLLEGEPAAAVDRGHDDLAVLMFTSGTVGSPRAAMLTHGNLRANLEQIQGHLGRAQRSDDVVFGVLPFFHIFGLNVVLGLTLFSGSRVVLVERFDPQSAIEAIARHGITIVGGAPPLWTAFANLPDVPDGAFATVRIAASGAAALPAEVARTVEARFGVHLVEGYGLTEAAPVVSTAGGSAAPTGSIGTPLPGVTVRLVDEGGDDVLPGDAGELWVQGPNIFVGYWGQPEATATALAGGWLHSGDVGVMDDAGFLYLVDRKKDLIIVSGFNVYPVEVEDALADHPAIEAVAVVGVPHPYTGEAVKAYVVPRAGASVEEDEVIAWCAQRLARYKCPEKILFVDGLPRGLTGKVLRRQLRDELTPTS
jgi:long-chain acyl-CoA synthetase